MSTVALVPARGRGAAARRDRQDRPRPHRPRARRAARQDRQHARGGGPRGAQGHEEAARAAAAGARRARREHVRARERLLPRRGARAGGDARHGRDARDARARSTCPPGMGWELRKPIQARSRPRTAAATATRPAAASVAMLSEARERVDDWPLERDSFDAVADGLERTYRRGRRDFRAARDEPSVEALHEWRKRVKDLWYHHTLLRELWPPVMTRRRRRGARAVGPARRRPRPRGARRRGCASTPRREPEFFEAVERRRAELQARGVRARRAALRREAVGVRAPARAALERDARQKLGHPNTMPASARRESRARRAAEVWAARAWNVFNEGRPFSVVYPLLVLLAAARVGLAPDGPLGLALLGARGGLARAVAVPVRAAGPRAALARRARRRAAARALARARRCSPARWRATPSSRSSSGARSTTTCAPARRGRTASASGGSCSRTPTPRAGTRSSRCRSC